jgi:hypothetical protein
MMISQTTAVPREDAMELRGEMKVPWNDAMEL